MQKNKLVLGHIDEIGVVMDYCIYDYRQEGLNTVERYIADSQLNPDSDDYTSVNVMSESFYTLVQVQDILPGSGVRVNDLLGEEQFFLIDIGLSHTAVRGMVLATRLLPFNDFVMTSGAALPVDSETLVEIFNTAIQPYSNSDNGYFILEEEQEADAIAAIIRLCLENNMFSQIEYQDVSDKSETPSIRREKRISRNEPCPCGSGKKYKRCCGR